MIYNVEEMNLLCVFDHTSKEAMLAEMKQSLEVVDDPEMIALLRQTMAHVEKMSKKDFMELIFEPALNEDEEWEMELV